MREVKQLKYSELDGLSEKQLREHHDVLYAGYVKKIGEIEEKLKTVDLSTANASYSDLRELKMEETFALNGVKLHEGYFDNMAPKGSPSPNSESSTPSGKIKEMLNKDFGSCENWEKEFKALGLSARRVYLRYRLPRWPGYNQRSPGGYSQHRPDDCSQGEEGVTMKLKVRDFSASEVKRFQTCQMRCRNCASKGHCSLQIKLGGVNHGN